MRLLLLILFTTDFSDCLTKCFKCHNNCTTEQSCECDKNVESTCHGDFCFTEIKPVYVGGISTSKSGVFTIFKGNLIVCYIEHKY